MPTLLVCPGTPVRLHRRIVRTHVERGPVSRAIDVLPRTVPVVRQDHYVDYDGSHDHNSGFHGEDAANHHHDMDDFEAYYSRKPQYGEFAARAVPRFTRAPRVWSKVHGSMMGAQPISQPKTAWAGTQTGSLDRVPLTSSNLSPGVTGLSRSPSTGSRQAGPGLSRSPSVVSHSSHASHHSRPSSSHAHDRYSNRSSRSDLRRSGSRDHVHDGPMTNAGSGGVSRWEGEFGGPFHLV